MRHYKRKTVPVPMPECPLYLLSDSGTLKVVCEAEAPAIRSALYFPELRQLSAWTRTRCKNMPGYKDCWIYQETERRWADDN